MKHVLASLLCATVLFGCTTSPPESPYDRSMILFQAGQYTEAIPILEDLCASIYPSKSAWPGFDGENVHMMLAESYARTDQYVKATEVFEMLCDRYDHPPIRSLYCAMGDAYLFTGQEKRARQCYIQVHEYDQSFDLDARIETLQRKASQQAAEGAAVNRAP